MFEVNVNYSGKKNENDNKKKEIKKNRFWY